MKSNRSRIILLVGIGCGALLLLCAAAGAIIGGLSIGGAMVLSQPIMDTGDAFMGALRDGDYATAYALASPQLQRELVNAQALQFMVERERVKPLRWSFSSRSIVNDTGVLEGSASMSGGEGTARLTLVKVGDAWRVRSVNLKLK